MEGRVISAVTKHITVQVGAVDVSSGNPFPVSGIFTGVVAISNFPSSFGRTWTLSFASDKVDASGSSVAISNFPSIQAVSQNGVWTTGRTWTLSNSTDSVNVGNFPGTQTIAGTVTTNQGTSPWVISHLSFASDKADVSGSTVLESTGTFSYNATTLTSGALTITGRVLSFRVFATGSDGSFFINTGNAITVRQDTGFDWSPRSPLINPVFNWLSGALDIFVEVAT